LKLTNKLTNKKSELMNKSTEKTKPMQDDKNLIEKPKYGTY
jgi:hypothetical protein